MTIRAKFFVTKIEQMNPANAEDGYRVELEPVYDGSPENKDFFKWTPGGHIQLVTINAAAAREFASAGADFHHREFYVDFTEAPRDS